MLVDFAPFAGRFAKRGEERKTVILCNNAGVPFSQVIAPGRAPSLAKPLGPEYFDSILNFVPPKESESEEPTDAPFRVKVTNFAEDGSQLVGLSVSHGVGDAGSIGALLRAWASALSGESGPPAPPKSSLDRSVLPPAPGFGEKPLVSCDGIPDAWRPLHRPMAPPTPKPYEPAVVTYVRSEEQIRGLKERFAPRPEFLSANDVICAEVAGSLGKEEQEVVKVGVVMNFRTVLGGSVGDLLGNAILTLDFDAPASEIAAAIRTALQGPVRTEEFVRWKVGQGLFGGIADVSVNSWVKGVFGDLQRLRFGGEGASPVKDIMFSEGMWRARAAAFKNLGLMYAMVLPHPAGGVKVLLMGPKELCESIQEGGAATATVTATCVPLA